MTPFDHLRMRNKGAPNPVKGQLSAEANPEAEAEEAATEGVLSHVEAAA